MSSVDYIVLNIYLFDNVVKSSNKVIQQHRRILFYCKLQTHYWDIVNGRHLYLFAVVGKYIPGHASYT